MVWRRRSRPPRALADLQGVVERVTLRSTQIRGLNGEIIWVNKQNIQGVRIAPRGIGTIALELFVTNRQAGEQLIDDTNARLPVGSLLLVSPLAIIEIAQVGDSLWQITAVGETALAASVYRKIGRGADSAP